MMSGTELVVLLGANYVNDVDIEEGEGATASSTFDEATATFDEATDTFGGPDDD